MKEGLIIMYESNRKWTVEELKKYIEFFEGYLSYLDDDKHDHVVDDVDSAKKWVNGFIEQTKSTIEQLKSEGKRELVITTTE